jgi:hypothetical protein
MSTVLLAVAPAEAGGLTDRASQALRRSPIPALRGLRVEEAPDGVTLTGRLSSYYLKQLAQETVMPVLGRHELHNEVVVARG